MSFFVIWLFTSIFVLKMIAVWTQRHRIAHENSRRRNLSKWLDGTFQPGDSPSESDRMFLRSGLNLSASGGRIAECEVLYSLNREFFPATSNFFHGAYEDAPSIPVLVAGCIAMAMLII
jgi:hypothetical protein